MPSMIQFRFGVLLAVLFACALTNAQPVGQVEYARGVGFAKTDGQTPRVMGAGLPLQQGDRLTTSDGAFAIVKLEDGTRMTVRPNTELLIQQYRFKAESQDNSMLLQLIRGGFRAVTGLISKSSPNAARVVTSTSTIGIRGTDFDARICKADCRAEASKVLEPARPNAVLASAKLVSLNGIATVLNQAGGRRNIFPGGAVYPGDSVETTQDAVAVFAFRDESRITVGGNARFKVDNFIYDQKNPSEGRFLVSLLRGSMRALTGLIGKANHGNVGFLTPTATVGIRGTGLDLDCRDGSSCSFFTWLGTIEVTPVGQTALQLLEAGNGLFVSRDGVQPLTEPTLDELQRPDLLDVDLQQLFVSDGPSGGEDGLYVFVRDGHIEIATGRGILHLGRGETGFAGPGGATFRPLLTPLFLDFDVIPRPDASNRELRSVLNDAGVRTINQCR